MLEHKLGVLVGKRYEVSAHTGDNDEEEERGIQINHVNPPE